MNETVETLSVGITVVLFFSIPFIFFAYVRYLRYKETITLAEKGLLRPSRRNGNGNSTLRWGIVITAIGMALSCALLPLGALSMRNVFPVGFGPWMIIGLLPLFFGLALIVIHVVTRRLEGNGGVQEEEADEEIPPSKYRE